jgi:hypothetical protein
VSNNDFEDYQKRQKLRNSICDAVRDGLQNDVVEPHHIEAILKKARNDDSFPFRFSERFKFDYFIQEERKNYPEEKNNLFAFAFGQIGRYEHFLTRILERYKRVSAEFHEVSRILIGPRKYSRWEEDERRYYAHQRQFELALQPQIDVESFYIFAKMFLDHIARSLHHFFGPVRGASLESHDNLVKCLPKYKKALSLEIPIEFDELGKDLKARIADYRDYQIAHNKMARPVHTTMSSMDQYLTMQISTWNPNSTEPPKTYPQSEPLLSLMELLDRYLTSLFEVVKANRNKSKLLRDPNPSGNS